MNRHFKNIDPKESKDFRATKKEDDADSIISPTYITGLSLSLTLDANLFMLGPIFT